MPRANKQADEILDLLGYACTIELIRAWGGRRIRVPKSLDESHPIVLSIGLSDAMKLCSVYGGLVLELPYERSAMIEKRNKAVYRARVIQGRECLKVAEYFGISPRHVRYICQKMAEAD